LPEIICNTSPLQYLHQLGVLDVLPKLVTTVTVPPAVEDELAAGRKLGLHLPDLKNLDWIAVRRPLSSVALPIVTDLGAGEREVLALALETPDSVCVLDDALARQIASALQLRITGTLGILIDAKRTGLIPANSSAARPTR
jgi:predicted nucleic acid-binding protein